MVGINRAALNMVLTARRRQEKKFGPKGTCANPAMDLGLALAILMEEVGEAAHEINEGAVTGQEVDLLKLRAELVQVAAVAVAWVEGLLLNAEIERMAVA